MSDKKLNLEKISGYLANKSKRLWGGAVICQLSIVGINIYLIMRDEGRWLLASIAGFLMLANFVLLLLSDKEKRLGDFARRKFEMKNGLGWELISVEKADLKESVPSKFWQASNVSYYSSKELTSPKRLAEIVLESAWWTKHLAKKMSNFILVVCLTVFLLAYFAIVAGIESLISNITVLENIVGISTSLILVLFSGDYLRLIFEYHRFYEAAKKTTVELSQLLKEDDILERDVIKLAHDYQIARAGAPSLPTWLRKLYQRRLNNAWNER